MSRIGQMRERVKIYEVTGIPDNIGGETTTRTLVMECWAKVEEQGDTSTDGRSQSTVKMYVRDNSYSITLKHLIEWRSNDYKPTSLVHDEKKRITTLQCQMNLH